MTEPAAGGGSQRVEMGAEHLNQQEPSGRLIQAEAA